MYKTSKQIDFPIFLGSKSRQNHHHHHQLTYRRQNEHNHSAAKSALVGERAGHQAVLQWAADTGGRRAHRWRRTGGRFHCFQVAKKKLYFCILSYTRDTNMADLSTFHNCTT